MAVNTIFGTINGLSNAQLSHLVSVSPGIKRGNFGNFWNFFTEGNKEFYNAKNSLSPEDWTKLQNVGYAAEVDYLSGTNLGNTLGKLQYTTPKAVSDILNTWNVNTRDAEVEKLPEPDREIVNKINRAYSSNPEYTHAAQGRQFLEGSFTNGYVVFGRAIENLFHGDPTDLINLGLAFDTGGASLVRTARLGEEAGEFAGVSRLAEGEAAGAGRSAEGATAEKNTGSQVKNNTDNETQNPDEGDKKDEQESEEGGHDEGEDEEEEACKLSECSPTVGSPVNIILGIKVLTGYEDCDFSFPATVPLKWQRSYYSDEIGNGWLGQGWFLPFSQEIFLHDHFLIFHDNQGREIKFRIPDEGAVPELHRYEQIYISQPVKGEYHLSSLDKALNWIFSHRAGKNRLLQSYVRDRFGNELSIKYNDKHQPEKIIDSSNRHYYIHFNDIQLSSGEKKERITGVSLAVPSKPSEKEMLCSYEYSTEGDLIKIINGSNEILRKFHYQNHLLVAHKRHGGVECFYQYDLYKPEGKVIRHKDSLGGDWCFEYEPGKTTVTDAVGQVACYEYDSNKKLKSVVDATGCTSFRRNYRGQIIEKKWPSGDKNFWRYDDCGNMLEQVLAKGRVLRIDYHPKWNRPVGITDSNGYSRYCMLGSKGEIIEEGDSSGEVITYEYDRNGNVIRVNSAGKMKSERVYNNAGMVTEHTFCSGGKCYFRYDRYGWLKEKIDALDNSIKWSRNIDGRFMSVTHPDGATSFLHYDRWGRCTGISDAYGQTRRWEFTPDGKLATFTNAAGNKVHYEYDKVTRRLCTIIKENGFCHTIDFDSHGNIKSEQCFDGRVINYQYDIYNRVVEKKNIVKSEMDFSITRYQYDDVNRTLDKWVIRRGEGRALRKRFEFDLTGRLVLARNKDSRVQLQWDDKGRLLFEECMTKGRNFKLQHTYDSQGVRATTHLPYGKTLKRLYYGSGHEIQVNIDSRPICEIERDLLNNETKRTQGLLISEYNYDSNGRLSMQVAKKKSTPVLSRFYSWGRNGELLNLIENEIYYKYSYDAVGRLTGVNNELFHYNSTGDLFVADCIKTKKYDAFGNLESSVFANGKRQVFKWDADNQLTSVETCIDGLSTHVEFGYDALGRRVWKTGNLGGTFFVWDGNKLRCEITTSKCYHFLYDGDSFSPLAQVAQDINSNNVLDEVFWYHNDVAGLPRELTDIHGNIVWKAKYIRWGRVDLEGPSKHEGNDFHQPLRYQGQYFDSETELHYNRFRYYDPDEGLYISPDPIGIKGGLNEYGYVTDPFNFSDPLGLIKCRVVYRADKRSPEEVFRDGFQARSPSVEGADLLKELETHVDGFHFSNFIATSASEDAAIDIADVITGGEGGAWLYAIEQPLSEGYDLSQFGPDIYQYPEQQEIAYRDSIAPNRILWGTRVDRNGQLSASPYSNRSRFMNSGFERLSASADISSSPGCA